MKINAIYLFSQNQYDLDLTHFIANQLETPVRSPSLETSFSKDEDFLGALWFIDANSTNFLKFFLNSVEKLKIGKGSIYFFADRKKSLRQIQEIKNKVHYGNVIFRSSDPIEKSAKKVFALSCFPENRPHFLFPENGRNSLQKKWSVKNFSEKQKVILAIEAELEALRINSRTKEVFLNSIDELSMNGLLDAAGLKNRDEQEYSKKIEVEISIGEEWMQGVITDHYGTFSQQDFFQHILDFFETNSIKEGIVFGRAGIGLSLLLKMGATLYYYCKPNEFTKAYFLFERRKAHKDFLNQFNCVGSYIEN